MFRKCYLHIGPAKTGTSSIQDSLDASRQMLLEKGIYYPAAPKLSYFFVSHFLENKSKIFENALLALPQEAIKDRDEKIIDAITSDSTKYPGHDLVLSSEYFINLSTDEMAALFGFICTIAESIELIFYVRDPILQAASEMQQSIWVNGGLFEPENLKPFDLKGFIAKINSVGANLSLSAQKFDKACFYNGDICFDFFKLIGIKIEDFQNLTIIRSNEGRSLEALLLADIYNKRVPFDVNAALKERPAVPTIARVSGTKFSLTAEEYAALRPQFDKSFIFIDQAFNICFETPTLPARRTPAWQEETLEMMVAAFRLVEKEKLLAQSNELWALAKYDELAGDLEAAESHYVEALKKSPSNKPPLDGLLGLLDTQQRTNEATEIAGLLFQVNQGSAAHLFEYKSRLIKEGRTGEARGLTLVKKPKAERLKLAK